MKKDSLLRIWIIALWPPVIFPIFFGFAQAYVRSFVSYSIDASYYWYWVSMITYAISGVIFAVIGFKTKEYYKRKGTLYANIVVGILVVLFFALFLLNLKANNFTNRIFGFIFYDLYRNWNLTWFAFAYTLYTSIKAIYIYRKQVVTNA